MSSAHSTMRPRARRNERRTSPLPEPWSGQPSSRPTTAGRGRRLVGAARNLSLAGRDEQAVERANQASSLVRDPILRAEMARVHGLAAIRGGRPSDVVAVLVDAAREVAPLEPARAVALLTDASIAAWQGGDRDEYIAIAQLAATIAPARRRRGLLAPHRLVRGSRGDDRGRHGQGHPAPRGGRGLGRDCQRVVSRPLGQLRVSLAGRRHGFRCAHRPGWGARPAARRVRDSGRRSRKSSRPAGARQPVRRRVRRRQRGRAAGRRAWRREPRALPRAALAIVAAARGHDEEARRHGEEVLARATARGMRLRATTAVYALALADLGRARWPEALARLESLLEGGAGQLDPLAASTTPDRIEAAVKAGRYDIAQAALPQLEARAAYAGARHLQPRLAACRALLAEGHDGTDHFEEALRLGGDARPLDLARIQLLYGEHLRRERRRTDARVQLRAALKGFERLQAEPWAERARVELRASGETARKRDPSTISHLTPQELQVARYVVDGLSNKAIAAQLFLSPRTIDSHLRRVSPSWASRRERSSPATASATRNPSRPLCWTIPLRAPPSRSPPR